MEKKRVVIFGTGSFGEVVHAYLSSDDRYEVVALTADAEYIDGDELFGSPVVPFDGVVDRYPPDENSMFIAIGFSDLNSVREQKYQEAKEAGYDMITYVSPHATVLNRTEIGENCFVFEQNVVQPFVEIGDNNILWSGNHVGHHSTIGDSNFLSSHVVVSGRTSIGDRCFFGVNSTIVDGISIPDECVIGAGSLVIDDPEDPGTYTGQPATKR